MFFIMITPQKSECNQLLEAAKTDDVITVERLINTRYIDVNTTDGVSALWCSC